MTTLNLQNALFLFCHLLIGSLHLTAQNDTTNDAWEDNGDIIYTDSPLGSVAATEPPCTLESSRPANPWPLQVAAKPGQAGRPPGWARASEGRARERALPKARGPLTQNKTKIKNKPTCTIFAAQIQ